VVSHAQSPSFYQILHEPWCLRRHQTMFMLSGSPYHTYLHMLHASYLHILHAYLHILHASYSHGCRSSPIGSPCLWPSSLFSRSTQTILGLTILGPDTDTPRSCNHTQQHAHPHANMHTQPPITLRFSSSSTSCTALILAASSSAGLA
jgi:hypothetical protein